MNKKFFFGMFAMAGLLLATSCSNEDLTEQNPASDELATVSFNISTEGAPKTRAISDGKSAKKLVYAVYDANGELISTIANADINGQIVDEAAFDNGLSEKVSLTLAKGQEYTVAFWAQNPDCTAYNTDNLKNVTVNYANAANNDETRDAFFKAETFTVTKDAVINITLNRPFAQINVGVTQENWDAAVASGISVKESAVEIKNAATAINLLDGSVSGETAVSYSLATIPAALDTPEALSVTANNTTTKYKWLSMSYILVSDANGGANKATLESDGLKFTFKSVSGVEIPFDEGLNNVPVQRNWRTNILGNILTGDITFNISINPIYDGDNNVTAFVSSKTEMEQALEDSQISKIVLNENLDGAFNATTAKEIDLNNKTITGGFLANAPLTIKNGTVSSTDRAIQSYANADVTLDNVNITSTATPGDALIQLGYIDNNDQNCGNGQVTIKNSTITSSGVGILICGTNNKLKIENSTITHKWFGITQHGSVPGSEVELTNVNISGTYSGIYLSNQASGAKNVLKIVGGSIHSDEESAIEVKKTDISIQDATLSSGATTQSYTLSGSGSNSTGYGIVLAGYQAGTPYEGTTFFENVTYNLAAQGANVVKILKYNGTTGEKVE